MNARFGPHTTGPRAAHAPHHSVRRRAAAVLITGAAIAMLAACTPGETPPAPSPTPTSTPAPTPSPTRDADGLPTAAGLPSCAEVKETAGLSRLLRNPGDTAPEVFNDGESYGLKCRWFTPGTFGENDPAASAPPRSEAVGFELTIGGSPEGAQPEETPTPTAGPDESATPGTEPAPSESPTPTGTPAPEEEQGVPPRPPEEDITPDPRVAARGGYVYTGLIDDYEPDASLGRAGPRIVIGRVTITFSATSRTGNETVELAELTNEWAIDTALTVYDTYIAPPGATPTPTPTPG